MAATMNSLDTTGLPPPLPKRDGDAVPPKIDDLSARIDAQKPMAPDCASLSSPRRLTLMEEITSAQARLRREWKELPVDTKPCWQKSKDAKAAAFLKVIKDRAGALRPVALRSWDHHEVKDLDAKRKACQDRLGKHTAIYDPKYLDSLAKHCSSDEERRSFFEQNLSKFEPEELKAIKTYLLDGSRASDGPLEEEVLKAWALFASTYNHFTQLIDKGLEIRAARMAEMQAAASSTSSRNAISIVDLAQGASRLRKRSDRILSQTQLEVIENSRKAAADRAGQKTAIRDWQTLRKVLGYRETVDDKKSYLKEVLGKFSEGELMELQLTHAAIKADPSLQIQETAHFSESELKGWIALPLIEGVLKELLDEERKPEVKAAPMQAMLSKIDFSAQLARVKQAGKREIKPIDEKALEASRQAASSRQGIRTALYDPETIRQLLIFKQKDIKEMGAFLEDTFAKFPEEQLEQLRDIITAPDPKVVELPEKSPFYEDPAAWRSFGRSHGKILQVIDRLLGRKDPLAGITRTAKPKKKKLGKSLKAKKFARIEEERHSRTRAMYVESMVHYETRDSSRKEDVPTLSHLDAITLVLPKVRIVDLEYYLEYKISEQTSISMRQKEKADALRVLRQKAAQKVEVGSSSSTSSEVTDSGQEDQILELTRNIATYSEELKEINEIISKINEQIRRRSDPNWKEPDEATGWSFWNWLYWGRT